MIISDWLELNNLLNKKMEFFSESYAMNIYWLKIVIV